MAVRKTSTSTSTTSRNEDELALAALVQEVETVELKARLSDAKLREYKARKELNELKRIEKAGKSSGQQDSPRLPSEADWSTAVAKVKRPSSRSA